MKKTLLFAFALLFATATMAQNRAVLLQESFDGASRFRLPTMLVVKPMKCTSLGVRNSTA